METCKFKEFLNMLEPWLDRDYVRKVFVVGEDHVMLFFSDGGQQDFRIDECSQSQLMHILEDIQKKGIPVEKAQ